MASPIRRTYTAWGRVRFVHPGKHGDKDLRVTFDGQAPTLAEMLAMLYGHFRAEDRYDEPWHEGRALFKRYIDEIYGCRSWTEAKPIIEQCSTSIKNPPKRDEPAA